MCIYVIYTYHVNKTIINHSYFDGLYHPFLGELGMVYYCFSNMIIYRVYIYIYVYEIDMVSFCHCEPSHCKAH